MRDHESNEGTLFLVGSEDDACVILEDLSEELVAPFSEGPSVLRLIKEDIHDLKSEKGSALRK